jgi:hypothetical protein
VTDFAAYLVPGPEFFQQVLTTSLDDGLDRFQGYGLVDLGLLSKMGTELTHVSGVQHIVFDHEAYVVPSYADTLFGHILIVPSRLDLGNILSNQSRTVEIANLFLTPQDWESLSTDVIGLTFVNPPYGLLDSPPTPYTIPSFGSYLLQVSIDANGPATIDGSMFFGFENEDIDVPVTGTRVIVFPFQPKPGISETLSWKTNVMEAHDGTEQRAGLRRDPRQSVRFRVILDNDSDTLMRGLLFDWLPRVFALPFWWEARRSTGAIPPGSLVIPVSTLYADFRVDGLVMVYRSNESYEVLEIESFDAVSITVKSEMGGDYDAGTLVMPAATAFSKTTPSAPRIPAEFTEYGVEFTVIDSADLADTTGSNSYDSKIILDDCNLYAAGEEDGWDRPVVVLDNDTGYVYQTSRTDRSRARTKKVWDCPDLEELWRVRRLLHHFNGSRLSFFLPTFRRDLQVSDTIGPNATTFRILECGYSTFYQSRRPFGDVRLVTRDGFTVVRRVIGAEIDPGTGEEVLTISAAFAGTAIDPEDILRMEFVNLVRIADDKAQIEHDFLGSANVEIALCTVKE